MNLALFHLVAYVIVGVACYTDSSENVIDCSISSVFPVPDPARVFTTWYGTAEPAGRCKGLPVIGSNLGQDAINRKVLNEENLASAMSCCLGIGCGPHFSGFCISRGGQCQDSSVQPFDSTHCPGLYSQCCPDPAFQPDQAGTEDNTNLFAQETLANPDITSGEEIISLANLNPDDWIVAPLENENLFLASDNSDDYGLMAGLGDSTGWDFESTA